MKKAEQANFPEFEAEMLKVWDTEKTFDESVRNREGKPRFRFYDGPPFPSGEPHYGHIEQGAIKDSVARYKTMRGFYAPRRTGWDTHGLPVEFLVEKELGFKSKKDIVNYGIDRFNEACRQIVFRYRDDFDRIYHRMGRWANPAEAYATLDTDYMETVWWVFAEIHKKGLVYQGFRSNPYCPRCATPLSNFEVNDGYKDDVEDPSVYVKFQLTDNTNTSLLAWTTTPWTLPANAALAVDGAADYVTVELTHDGDGWKKGERLILAKQRVGELELRKVDLNVVETCKGSELVGLCYEPLYELAKIDPPETKKAWHVFADDSVSLEDGTGILHIAPQYGETDLALGQREGLPLIESADATGHMNADMGEFAGMWFKEADDHVVADLTRKGRIFAAERFKHTYPFCWRCETPLMYLASPSWYVAVTKLKDQLVKAGESTRWTPEHVKTGRFIKWLEGARDWAISRNRFWGTTMPVWQCADGHSTVVSSKADLAARAIGQPNLEDLHKPGIDEVVIKCDECGKKATRIPEVFDCWFESGSMPYGQDHYPFENKSEFDSSFPADFVVEALEQVNLWFYTLHVLAVALFDKPAYKNVLASGLILAADGRKLSKRLRNYPPVHELFDKYGVDSVRYFFLESPLMYAEATRLDEDTIRDVQRNVFLRLWNVYSFFSTYAEVDKWGPGKDSRSKTKDQGLVEPKSDNVLDQWLIARLNQVIAEMTKQADDYRIAQAVRPLRELIDDLSNWYVRRSRRRFWKSEDDGDKQAAYKTLHYVLVRIAQLLAPWSPFVADKLWRELTVGMDAQASVHLSDWPEAGDLNQPMLSRMSSVREAITSALSARAEEGIKVRQPLPGAIVNNLDEGTLYLDIIQEELNVKHVSLRNDFNIVGGDGTELRTWIKLDTTITPELKREGMMRDIVRYVQNARKQAGLKVDDRIVLQLEADDSELKKAIVEHAETIKAETLAQLGSAAGSEEAVPVMVAGCELLISLERA